MTREEMTREENCRPDASRRLFNVVSRETAGRLFGENPYVATE